MLSNQEIIESFTEEQKIKLVTGFAALSDDRINALGVPKAAFASLDELNVKFGSPYPAMSSLAQSWNSSLFAAVAADLSFRAATEINAVYTPPAFLRSNAYAAGLSEDPFFVKSVERSFCTGISRAGLSAFVPDCSVRQIDAKYMDKLPDARAIQELLLRPYAELAAKGTCQGLCSAPKALKRKYASVNADHVQKVYDKKASGVKIVHINAPQDVAVSAMASEDEFVADTSAGALRAAVLNYRRMKADVDRGAVSLEELNKAVSDGVAVSDEMLDEAVDKIIGFAVELSEKSALISRDTGIDVSDEQAQADYESKLALRRAEIDAKQKASCGDLEKYRKNLAVLAAKESMVLLKNNGALPVSKGKKIAVVGEAAKYVPNLIDILGAGFLERADITYLGYADGYKSDAPDSDYAPQAVTLAENADVVLVFLGHGKQREKTMAEDCRLALPAGQLALTDKIKKQGKTVVAVTVGSFLPDLRFMKQCDAVLFVPDSGKFTASSLLNIVTGVNSPVGRLAFSGYYDTDIYYKSLRDMKNAGRNKVGVFLGYRHYVTGGTSVRCPFGYGLGYSKFEYSKLKRDEGGFKVTVKNTGKYDGSEVVQLYAQKLGSRIVRPTRELKGFAKVNLKAHEHKQVFIAFDPADLAVYDPVHGSYRTEAGTYRISVGASCTDIRLTTDITVDGVGFEKSEDKLSDYIYNVSNVVSDGYILPSGGGKKQKFTPQALPDFPYEKLFLDEFGAEIEEDDDIDDDAKYVVEDDDDDIGKYIGVGVTPDRLVEAFADCMSAQGLEVKRAFIQNVLAGLATSRLLFVCTEDASLFADFATALGGFFSCDPVGVNAASFTAPDDMFVGTDGTATSLAAALASSKQHHSKFRLIAGTDFDPATMNGYFTPFIRYISNPENNRITYGDYGDPEKTFVVAPNIWFVLCVTPEQAASIPPHIADISALARLDAERGHGTHAKPDFELNYYKFVNAFEKADKLEIREEHWKMIDKLCGYVGNKCGAHITNKMWIQMEKFISAFMSVGGEEQTAADAVVAAKLVPLFAPMLKDKLTRDDGDFAQTVGSIFGDDNVPESTALCKTLGLRPRK